MRVVCLYCVKVQVMGFQFLFFNNIADISEKNFTFLILVPDQYFKEDLFTFCGIILETHVMNLV